MAPSFDHSTTASELVAYYSDKVAGKNILVTGVTPGSLGSSFVQQVAAGKPSTLVLTGRDPSKFQSVVDDVKASHPEIKVKSLTMDLSSLASVRAAAETFNNDAEVPYLDVLVLNAGIMGVSFSLTEDGFESQFQVNHLSHFLFSNLIMGKVLASPSPRIVVVSSNGHVIGGVRWSDWNFSSGKHYDPWLAYAQSKTANNLMAVALAERLGATKGLQAFSMHPGVIMSTGLGARAVASMGGADLMEAVAVAFARTGSKYMFEAETAKSLDQGTATHVVAAFDTDLATPENNGAHLINSHLADPYAQEVFSHSVSKIDADRLWKLSEKLVGQEFLY